MNKVILCWMSDPYTINTLTWHSGTPRVYEKDKYDPRAGDGLPFFTTAMGALLHMTKNLGPEGACQIQVGKASKALGFVELN